MHFFSRSGIRQSIAHTETSQTTYDVEIHLRHALRRRQRLGPDAHRAKQGMEIAQGIVLLNNVLLDHTKTTFTLTAVNL